MSLADSLLQNLSYIPVLPRRMLLDTGDIQATAPMLRGVWGAALHDLDLETYQTVFHPESSADSQKIPAYILRPAAPDPEFAPAVEWVCIGQETLRYQPYLWMAWGMAMEWGLGKQREPFRIARSLTLGPEGETLEQDEAWTLDQAVWPLAGNPARSPCRLVFLSPLCLLREKRLIKEPTLKDLIVRTCRRIQAFLPSSQRETWRELSGQAIELSNTIPAEKWRGGRLDLKRYSASQDREFHIQGVCGELELPQGAGELWPVLLAASWIHVGKSTIVGLGQMRITGTADER